MFFPLEKGVLYVVGFTIVSGIYGGEHRGLGLQNDVIQQIF